VSSLGASLLAAAPTLSYVIARPPTTTDAALRAAFLRRPEPTLGGGASVVVVQAYQACFFIAAGLTLAEIEIDHDCATSQLPRYAEALARLRPALDGLPLSVTALPTWLGAPALREVIAASDEISLQAHAVLDPRRGLFDPALAESWARRMATLTNKPFRLALPTYGSRVSFSSSGALASIESEAPDLFTAGDGAELMAAPDQVAALVTALRRDPPPHLVGLAWFRLPTNRDRRAWSLATWRAVARGHPAATSIAAQVSAGRLPGLYDVTIANPGDIDTALPARIALPAGCIVADGLNGYALAEGKAGLELHRRQPGLLRAHERRPVGWIRCTAPGETLDVHA
jgi:hypothetical protein